MLADQLETGVREPNGVGFPSNSVPPTVLYGTLKTSLKKSSEPGNKQ